MFLESINIFHQAHMSSAAGKEPSFTIELKENKVLEVNHVAGKIDDITIKYGKGIQFSMRPSPQGVSKIKLGNLPPGKIKVELKRQGKTYSEKFNLN